MAQAPARRDTSESSDVASLVTLHHRRRGWAWVAMGSVLGLAVYVGLDLSLFENLTGTAGTLSVIPVLVLLVLVLAGLAVVIADTARIHRADPGVRVSAKGRVSHYPLYAQAHRYPPHHRGSWVVAIVMLVAMTGITVFILPADVNSWAYVVGAENHDTFHPVSYRQTCVALTRGLNCAVVTEGYLSRTGAHVSWSGQVPLAQRISVGDPLWAWGSGRGLISSDSSAIGTIIAGLFFDGVTLLLLYVLVVVMRETSSERTRRTPVPAGAHPGAARRAHPADPHHYGGGRSRRARRGQGRH